MRRLGFLWFLSFFFFLKKKYSNLQYLANVPFFSLVTRGRGIESAFKAHLSISLVRVHLYTRLVRKYSPGLLGLGHRLTAKVQIVMK